MISNVAIANFKNLSRLQTDLEAVNVLVGANNSGKSSVLHAVHFAVSVAQSRPLLPNQFPIKPEQIAAEEELERDDEESEGIAFEMSPSQLLYTPTASVGYLWLKSDEEPVPAAGAVADYEEDGEEYDGLATIQIQLRTPEGHEGLVRVQIRKSSQLRVTLKGLRVISALEGLESPYSVYVPGLAGLARNETLMPLGLLRRAVARGDANLVLRNVLYRLQRDGTNWIAFKEALKGVFPGADMIISFEDGRDEYIDVTVTRGGPWLPLDCMGTGFLQTAQILSYIHLFRPRVTLLDEPDSHLHPNNQRALMKMLQRMAAAGETQVTLATHSRHVLDALSDAPSKIWIRSGGETTKNDHLDMLFELGALDSAENLLSGKIKRVVLTEDTEKKSLKTLIEAAMPDCQYSIWSYKGCSNFHTASTLAKFINEVSPNTKVIVHRDSDYLSEPDCIAITEKYAKQHLEVFFTTGVDIESAYCSLDHLLKLNPNHPEPLRDVFAESLAAMEAAVPMDVALGLTSANDIRKREGMPQWDRDAMETWARSINAKDPRWIKGKSLLKLLLNGYKTKTKVSLIVYQPTEHIKLERLAKLLG